MPGKVKVKIISGRNLPVMDRSSDTTDAYVEIKLGSTTYKTDVCRKSLHPQWNTEWYRFEVDDSELQDEPLQIRLMDHDTYSANDAIGKVYLNLNPLLLPAAGHLNKWNGDTRTRDNVSNNTTMMSGWLPVYDTMHGIRGEVNITVKVEHFSDFNKFRQSSCGVQFFCSPSVPHGFHAHTVHGFVEELIVNDDPEYQWIDKIRTPRASNEARQTLFCKLAGELQRKIGVKALDLGGNAVIGYRQSFDLEGESGIVARGIGTAVSLVKISHGHAIPGTTAEELNGDERATLSYMRFLGSTKRFFLNNPITNSGNNINRSVLYNSVSPFLCPPPLIPPAPSPIYHHHKQPHSHIHHHTSKPLAQITRHLSDKEMNQARPSPDSMHHSHSLHTLLKQEDMRGRPQNSTYRISNRFWRFKHASRSKLSKRITHLKAKLSDNEADVRYKRTHSDSSGMAEILVRSVIQAANSLDCIAEAPTPSSSPAFVVVASTSDALPSASSDLPRADVGGSYLSLPSTSLGSCSSKTSQSSLDDDDNDDDDDEDDDDDDDDEDDEDEEDDSQTGIEDIGEVVKNARKLSMIPLDSSSMHIEDLKTRNENTKNVFYLELAKDVTDDVDNSDTLSEPVNFSPSKPTLIVQDVKSETEDEEETVASGNTVLGVPFTNIFRLQALSALPMVKNQFYRRSISHTMDQCHIIETPAVKKQHHRSHETVLGVPFTNIFRNNNVASPPPNGHDSAVLHIEREIEVSESIPVTNKPMNKSATFICLKELAEQSSEWPKGKSHHKSHETLQTIPFGSIFQSREHVTVQFPETIQEGATLKFTCDRTVTRDKLVKSSTSTSLSEYFSNKNQTPRKTWNKSLDIVFDELSNQMNVPETAVSEAPTPSGSDGKATRISKLVNFAKKTKDTVVSKLQRTGSTIRDKNSLLSTALGNVLMETVKEMLVTSSQESPVQVQTVDDDKTIQDKRDQATKSPPTKKSALHIVRSFFKRNSLPKSDADEVRPGGLLQCALDNVLMETANEMLVTSQPTKRPSNNNPFIFSTNPTNTGTDHDHQTNTIESTHAHLTINRLDEEVPLVAQLSASPPPTPPPTTSRTVVPTSQPQPIVQQMHHHQRSESVGASTLSAKVIPPPLQPPLQPPHSPAKLNSFHRRSSDSDLSVTSKGNSLTGSDRSGGYSSGHYMRANNALIRSTVPQENFDILEYPFLTMSQYPLGFIAFLGGAVNARSVKLLERITNFEEPESRDIWWSEIRMEIRSHARALNCNAVLGYKETTSICEEVCVLSASGTAAVIGYQSGDMIVSNDPSLITTTIPNTENMTSSLDRNDFEKERLVSSKLGDYSAPNTPQVKTMSESPDKDLVHQVLTSAQIPSQGCTICHLPYKAKVVQLRNTTSKCSVCRSRKVPDVLIATIELPEGIPTQGRGCFLQSYVCRPLKDLKGESNAKEISDGLPFLEYELHRLLLNKLKVKGMNAIFGLNVRISIGERMLIGIATGTAVFLTPLPVPPVPKLRSTDEEKLAKLQRKLHETVKKNREIYQLFNDLDNNRILSDDDSDDDRPAMELNSGNKDCCVLEVDDPEDVTELNLLMEPRPPDGFHVVNTERVPGGLEDLEIVKNLQMFTQVWRSRVQAPYNFDRHFHRLLQTVYFKLRRMVPCALCHLQFRVESPEPDEIQLCVLGMALGLGDPQKNSKLKRKNIHQKRNDEDLIFNIEDDLIPENNATVNTNYLHTTQNVKHRQKSPVRNKFTTKQHHLPYKERHGVDITPLSYVPGGKIEKYLGNLNFFFIRETNSIREEGGLSGFMHSFITEVLAIVRSHVTALGGNAMVAYYLTECTLNHNLHKNQGQCLINVGGDVVFVSYYTDDH